MIFVMASGNSSATSVDRSCFSCYLDVLKPNYFLKLSNHILLELNSPALEPSPTFCFKLSYNNFDFSLITLGPIRMSFLEPSCAQIKAVLSIWDKKAFHKKCNVSAPAGIAAVTASWISFSFFLQWSLHPIHLSWNDRQCSCRPQSTVHIKQFSFFL